jgi:hypothetical protein
VDFDATFGEFTIVFFECRDYSEKLICLIFIDSGQKFMLLDMKSMLKHVNCLHVKEDFRERKDGFCLGLDRFHQ